MRKRIATARGDLTGDGAPESLVLSGEQSASRAIMDVPPTITAAMMFISEPVPIAGWTVAKRAP